MSALRALFRAIRQKLCRHVFRGADLPARQPDGFVYWPCCKCGKVHRLEAGIFAPGQITGPWSSK